MFNEAGLEPHEPTIDEELTAKLRSLLQNRKLIERCVRQEYMQMAGSDTGFSPTPNSLIDYTERLWQRDPLATEVLTIIMEDIGARGRSLIEQGYAKNDIDGELAAVVAEHTLLHELRALVNITASGEPFPLTRTEVGPTPNLTGTMKSWADEPQRPSETITSSRHGGETSKEYPKVGDVAKELGLPAIEMIPQGEIVMLPPDDFPKVKASEAEGVSVDERTIERNSTLEALLAERRIAVIIVEGLIPPGSMRNHPYNAFLIEPRGNMKGKIVFVNDEHGNATFVVHEVDDTVKELPHFADHTKSELRALGWEKVTRIIYPGDLERWKSVINIHIDYDAETLRENVERNRRERMVGYMSGNSLSKLLKRDYGIGIAPFTVKKFADVLVARPEFAGREPIVYSRAYMAESKGDAELYTPDFADYLLEFCITVSKPNEQWRQVGGILQDAKAALSAAGLATSLDHHTVDTMLRELLLHPPAGATGPVETRNFIGRGTPPKEGRIPNNVFGLQEHFSPTLCQAAIDQLVRETARPGWRTINGIEADLATEGIKVNFGIIWDSVKALRATGNSNFEFDYFRGTGAVRRTDDTDPRAANPRLRLYVSPDLADAVKARLRIRTVR